MMEGGEFPQPKHILRRLADKLTGRKAPEQPEKAEELEKFVIQGLKFIKSGQYSSAIRYFENSQEANRLGLTFFDEGMTLLIERLPIKDVVKIVDTVAQRCHFYKPAHTYKGEKPTIKLPGVVVDINPKDPEGPFSLAGENLPESLASQIPVSLFHNVALNYAEEWLHTLQFFRGGQSIAGYKNTEIDVAAYLQNQGVPLTDEFLARYQRRAVLFEGKSPPTIPIA